MPKDKIVVISLGSPYVVNEYFEKVDTCINAYSNIPEICHALLRALTGKVEMKGISPVNLDIQGKFKVY